MIAMPYLIKEDIVSDEFVDLDVEDEPKNAKAARSTAGKER